MKDIPFLSALPVSVPLWLALLAADGRFGLSVHAALLGPTPYLSPADSPFAVVTFNYFHLEDFEDAALQPGFSASGNASTWIRLGPGVLTDSVDSDDSVVDGSGTAGSSLYSAGANSSLEIAFDPGVLGSLPTEVGIVWTDVGVSSPTLGIGEVTFEAFDAANLSLGLIGPVILGDGSAAGATGEDRFFGASHPAGIRRFVISMSQSTDWEVDHLQYGRSTAPLSETTPTLTFAVLAAGVLAIARHLQQCHP